MSSLYEINQQILDVIDLDTGEVIDEAAFDALQIERTEKIENVALWYKNLVSQAEALKSEEKSFAERRKTVENRANSLKSLLERELKGNKFSTVKAAISFRKSTAVNIVDESLLPSDYLKVQTVTSVDKVEIGKALKAGIEVSGATLVENSNIQIK